MCFGKHNVLAFCCILNRFSSQYRDFLIETVKISPSLLLHWNMINKSKVYIVVNNPWKTQCCCLHSYKQSPSPKSCSRLTFPCYPPQMLHFPQTLNWPELLFTFSSPTHNLKMLRLLRWIPTLEELGLSMLTFSSLYVLLTLHCLWQSLSRPTLRSSSSASSI